VARRMDRVFRLSNGLEAQQDPRPAPTEANRTDA
jgi:hypothetical protein